uniref:Uncharacterized protein n=1 Tax=Cercocebus atys TaxID=9531 RepID=A0A2K5KY29_CERAT
MRGKTRMADFFPFRDRALHKDGPTAPVTFPSPLSARGGRGRCRLGRCGRRPARRERLRDARPVVSVRPGTDIPSSAASPGPAPSAGDPGGSARPRPAARPPAPLGSALALAF